MECTITTRFWESHCSFAIVGGCFDLFSAAGSAYSINIFSVGAKCESFEVVTSIIFIRIVINITKYTCSLIFAYQPLPPNVPLEA